MSNDELKKNPHIADIELKIQILTNELDGYKYVNGNRFKIADSFYHRFFKLCDRLSYHVNSMSLIEKRALYFQITTISIRLRDGSENTDKFKLIKNQYLSDKAFIFLEKYIELRKSPHQTIEQYRNLYSILEREQDLSKVKISSYNKNLDGKTIQEVFIDAFRFKGNDKKKNKIAEKSFYEIQKFFDREAFKHYAILRSSNSGVLDGFIHELNTRLGQSGSLFQYTPNFFDQHLSFFIMLYDQDYTLEYINIHNLCMSNPFHLSNANWYEILSNEMPFMINYQYNIDVFLNNEQLNSFLNFVLTAYANDNFLYFDLGAIEKYCEGFVDFTNPDSPDYNPSYVTDLSNFKLTDSKFFQERSALPVEKPSIPPTPDHPMAGKPEIAPTPANPSQGKPEITAHGKKPETSLKKQSKGKSNQQEEIKDMLALSPTELPKEKALTDGLLSYSFLSSLKGGRAFVARQFPMVDRLVQRFMPQLIFVSNLSSNLLQKTTATPSTDRMRGASSQKTATLKPSGNSKSAPGKKAGMGVKGHFITYAVFIGLETLHAKLINSGYTKAASFVPVTSNWRPWGNAFFANIDHNLQINPESGYSTTRLFNHVADATAYLAEGVSNSINYVGNAEASFHSILLDKEVTGFDARFFGLINGATEVGYGIVDTLGGSLDKRRAKAQEEFNTNHPNEKETLEEKTSRLQNSILKERHPNRWTEPNKIGLKTTKPSIPKTSSKMKDIDVKDLKTSKTNPAKAKPSQLTYKASLYNKAPKVMGKVDAKANLFDRKHQKTWATSNSLFTKTEIKIRSAKPGNGQLGVIPRD